MIGGDSMNCKQYTSLVIEKDGEYLVGVIVGTRILRWSNSPYDAWMTRKPESAARVSDKVGGQIMLFNPIVGQIRRYRNDTR